jgi:metal-dependent amidase/aminoacylase/carboxypeptidase family protein
VLGYVNLAALRQHIRSDERIHGIFTEAGDKPNIVPSHAAAQWYVRAGTLDRLRDLEPRVEACLRAGAEAAGCEIEIEWKSHHYTEVRDNEALLDLYAANSALIGRPLEAPTTHTGVAGSTDMGNVSYRVPSIHPMIQVSTPGVSIHTPEFATFAGGPDGDRAVLDGAKAMAQTVADLWLEPAALHGVRAAFGTDG